MSRRAVLAPLAVVVTAAALAGCGSSSSASSSNAAASVGAGGALTLSETEFKITPAAPSVSGTGTITITVKNNGAITHALAVQTPSGLVKTRPITPGATATLKVDAGKAGRYTFYCPIGNHRAAGMQGVLVVGSAAGSGGSGATSTSASPTKKVSAY